MDFFNESDVTQLVGIYHAHRTNKQLSIDILDYLNSRLEKASTRVYSDSRHWTEIQNWYPINDKEYDTHTALILDIKEIEKPKEWKIKSSDLIPKDTILLTDSEGKVLATITGLKIENLEREK